VPFCRHTWRFINVLIIIIINPGLAAWSASGSITR